MSTPALDRAAEALYKVTIVDPESTERYAERLARAAVSAALHDPDGDVIDDAAAALAAKNGRRWSVMAEPDREQYREFARAALDAARAAILGEAS